VASSAVPSVGSALSHNVRFPLRFGRDRLTTHKLTSSQAPSAKRGVSGQTEIAPGGQPRTSVPQLPLRRNVNPPGRGPLHDICRRSSRPLASCVRSDQPPRYQDTQPLSFVRLAGGSLQTKTTCSSKFAGWDLTFIPRSSCLHQGPTRARGPKFRPCDYRANCQ
jgi:hypothetical protein